MTLSADRLRALLRYDADTGYLHFINAVGNVAAGSRAGFVASTGYVRVGVDGSYYMAHRLAWLHAHGAWPAHFIDHINGNKADNRLCNLRDVTREVNLQNQHRAHSNSSTGFLGVMRQGDKFIARRRIDGHRRHLGTFDDAAEAHAAYVRANPSVGT